jgi:spoIIIJ-associated protein
MEWVVTTGKTIDEAKEHALDQLGVASDDAEFEVVEEPRTGLFGRIKNEARVRARVKPTQVRPKQDRRDRRRGKTKAEARGGSRSSGSDRGDRNDRNDDGQADDRSVATATAASAASAASTASSNQNRSADGDTGDGQRRQPKRRRTEKENTGMQDDTSDTEQSDVTPDEVGEAAVAFMSGLADAFGYESSTSVEVDDIEIDVRVDGEGLGLLVGPGGRTLTAVQDLARVASQRRLGDHQTRLRIDVGGYREKRKSALEKFAVAVAQQVIDSGTAKALEPMSSADRKSVHDAITEIDGVQSRSEGDDPNRRVVIAPA